MVFEHVERKKMIICLASHKRDEEKISYYTSFVTRLKMQYTYIYIFFFFFFLIFHF